VGRGGKKMILQALEKHYEVLLEDKNSGIAPLEFCSARVSFAAIISKNGELLDLEDLRINNGKKLLARDMIVPEQVIKTSGTSSNFLCENASYAFGLPTKNDIKKSRKEFKEFERFHEEILSGIKIQEVDAFLSFLSKWNPEISSQHPILKNKIEDLNTGNIVFKMEGTNRFFHEIREIKNVWSLYKKSKTSKVIGQCLLSGKIKPLASLHHKIKGVAGSQTVGASIVSFNKRAFTSYGKEQSLNSPISEESMFAYTTTINYLLSSRRNNIRIGDTTAIFWAEKSTDGLEESIFTELFDPIEENTNGTSKNSLRREPDSEAAKRVKSLLERLKNGQSVYDDSESFDVNTNFYILGLSPNAARLSVRFWYRDSFGRMIEKMLQHQLDMDIIRPSYANSLVTPWRILKEVAPNQDQKNISPLLAGNLARSIFSGQVYGEGIYTSILSRIRADGKVNDIRAGMIKACLIRKERKKDSHKKEVLFTVSLNLENNNIGYRLGRLFAVMEKTQLDANPNLNATIKDRYFGAASTTPGSVFPILIKLSQHHMSKAEYGRARDSEMSRIMETVESFPPHMTLEDQGQFILGYYHQKQSFYTKKINNGGEEK
jgi:CRISPR-associated protein Csd1